MLGCRMEAKKGTYLGWKGKGERVQQYGVLCSLVGKGEVGRGKRRDGRKDGGGGEYSRPGVLASMANAKRDHVELL